jgi:hypothetical protein
MRHRVTLLGRACQSLALVGNFTQQGEPSSPFAGDFGSAAALRWTVNGMGVIVALLA